MTKMNDRAGKVVRARQASTTSTSSATTSQGISPAGAPGPSSQLTYSASSGPISSTTTSSIYTPAGPVQSGKLSSTVSPKTPSTSGTNPSTNSTHGSGSSFTSTSANIFSNSTSSRTVASTASPVNTSGTVSHQHTTSGLSTGAKAGIGAGAGVLVLAIIAGLVFLYRKKSSSSRHNQGPGPRPNSYEKELPQRSLPPGTSGSEKPIPIAGAWSTTTTSSIPEQDYLLPQQADDATVRQKFGSLYDQIELHIENFYRDASPMIPPATEGALSRYDTPVLSDPLAASLEESPRATTLLKHVLSYEITATTLSPEPGKRSILPVELLTAFGDVQRQQRSPGSPPPPAYRRFKQLAASYRADSAAGGGGEHNVSAHRSSSERARAAACHDSAQHFCTVFGLWADPRYGEDRRLHHLAEVMNSAIEFAIWLFSHPEQFETQWGTTTNRSGSLVTVPALFKSTHGGQMMTQPQLISEAVSRSV